MLSAGAKVGGGEHKDISVELGAFVYALTLKDMKAPFFPPAY